MTQKAALLSVSLVVLILLSMVGCGHRTSTTHTTLVYIDSLLQHGGEQQALRCVKKMNDSAMDEAQKAYYYLLLTQAKYKNDIVATTDEQINFAVQYYAKSKDEYKYMRSLLYQGAVNEELGNADKAVDCYHRVECMAEKLDSFHLAYAKMRMGFLYLSHPIGAPTIALNKFVEAERIFEQLGEKKYRLLCQIETGGLYRAVSSKADSSIIVLNKAFKLARELQNRVEMFCIKHTIGDYYRVVALQPDSSIKYAQEALHYTVVHPRAHYALASSYAEINKIDSAQYYLDHAPERKITLDTITYFWAKYKLAMAKRQYDTALRYYLKSDSLTDSVFQHSMNAQLLAVEKQYDKQHAELENMNLQSELKTSIIVAVALVCVVLLLVLVVWRYKNRAKMQAQEYELIKVELDASMANLSDLQNAISRYQSQLSSAQTTIENMHIELSDRQQEKPDTGAPITDEMREIVDHQIGVVQELIRWSWDHESDSASFVKRFRNQMSITGPLKGKNYWYNLKKLVNTLYDNVLEKAQQMADGTLSDDEINVLALLCCGYARVVIMSCMGYKNVTSVSNKKSKIAKKMNVTSLDAFILHHCGHKSID